MFAAFDAAPDATRIVHLAAQAGVRLFDGRSLRLRLVQRHGPCRRARGRAPAAALDHLVYASSSSVYGGNTKLPFAEADRVDTPLSLYAATKRADELMSHAYWHLYGMPLTGLRFFTVYGPWGRPDMAYYSFAEAILAGRARSPSTTTARLRRDFTYIDDIVAGVLGCLDRPPAAATAPPRAQHRQQPQRAVPTWSPCWRKASAAAPSSTTRPARSPTWSRPAPTSTAIEAYAGYRPTDPAGVGIPRFVEWFSALQAQRWCVGCLTAPGGIDSGIEAGIGLDIAEQR